MQKIEYLYMKHAQLEKWLEEASDNPDADIIDLAQIKKKKLIIKDEIEMMENQK